MYRYALLFIIAFITPVILSQSNSNKYITYAVPNSFDINEAYTQLMFSYSAYCPKAIVQNWTCYYCHLNETDTKGFVVSSLIENVVTNTFGYVGLSGSGTTIEVVFRGTQSSSLLNWISDFDYAKSKSYPGIPNAYVHSGFLDTYDVVKTQVRNAVAYLTVTSKATRIVFTGHSLGAALTTLAAIDIAPTLKIPVFVYNYGSPRVGNQVFSDYFYKLIPNTIRIVNKDDIVPHLPVESMGFHHVAQEVWWKSNDKYVLCDATGEDKTCSDSTLLKSVTDHTTYLQIQYGLGNCV